MKKKIIILISFIILLIPLNIKAYTYKGINIDKSNLISKNYIKVWPSSTSAPKLYVSNTSYLNNNEKFYFHSVVNGSNVYVGHSSNIGRLINNDNYELDRISSFDTLENNNNNLTNEQRRLLENLITNGYQYDTTNTKKIDNILSSKDYTLSMIAMQILIWEVMEGGRTTFTSLAPDNINVNSSSYKYSFYNQLVYPNGGETNEGGTLFYYYKKIVKAVNDVTNPESSTAFNTDIYSLSWDGTNNKYRTTVTGLGKYTKCVSSDSNVNVSVSIDKAYIESKKLIDESTITCSYAVGGGVDNEFYYYKFKSLGNCSIQGSCSNVIYGSGKKIYTRSFKVTTKKAKIKVRSVDINKQEISNSVYKFQHRATSSYTFNVKGNSETKELNKSGEYIVSEVAIPTKYEYIPDFNIKIDTSNNIVEDCSNKGIDSNGNTTCSNGRVVVTKEDDTIVLTITFLEKNFKLVTINENNDVLKGTTFQILDSSNKVMKFKYSKGLFTYDTNGVTDIYSADTGTYGISNLPSGTYSIVETSPVSPYRLPSKESERITKIKINNTGDLLVYDEAQNKYVTAVNSSVVVRQYRTLVRIMSVKNGTPMKDVSYSLYASDKTTLINSKLVQTGIYNYLDDQSSDEAVSEYITDDKGYISIYDLPVGTYYFRVNILGNTSLVEVKIDVTKDGATVNGSKVLNTISLSTDQNSFSFYKTDENGNYLSNGQFKLQRYDNTKARYVDLKLVQTVNDGTYNEKAEIFKEDANGKRVFTLKNGIATFIDMKPGSQYRIIETTAPDGYVLQTVSDSATVTIDDSGNAYGLLVLTNKKISGQSGQAQAELIINIDTGQTRIKYAILIGSIVITIGVLIIIQRKKK